MKSKTFSAIGGWQSFLFCVGMYVVALFFAIFVCSSIFYAVNSKNTVSKAETAKTPTSNPGKQELASMAP
jgi:quinol-cytochrome oxidoreductase complex cytochrome b subunit